jgi:hypothetical protein
MPLPATIEACRLDMFASEDELREKYPVAMAERILRVREMYNYWLANPDVKDRRLRDLIMSRYDVSQSAAYSDIALLHQLVPLFSQKSRDFHRARYCEMILETYQMAKARKDTKTMERAASSYAKYTGADRDDETSMPYDEIVPQPFVATTDPSVLGIKAIPNLYDYISKLSKELSKDCIDVDDVEYEEADLEEAKLFAPITPDEDADSQD